MSSNGCRVVTVVSMSATKREALVRTGFEFLVAVSVVYLTMLNLTALLGD